DARIQKPRIHLREGTLLATTGGLLRASGLAHERLRRTGVRTPLGEVVVARLAEAGIVELAGPSAAADVCAVSEAMEELGAEQVLIDGAIDRRAASAPEVADGLVMATGVVLGSELEQVVARTVEAVELARLPTLAPEGPAGERASGLGAGPGGHLSALIGADGEVRELPARFALSADERQLGELLDGHAAGSLLLIGGALPGRLLDALLALARRRREPPTVLVGDPTRVFLGEHGVA